MTDSPLPPHDDAVSLLESTAPSPRKLKQRQQIMLFGVGIVLFVVVIGGMWLAAPPPAKTARAEDKEATIKRLAVPGQQLNEREVWVAKGEARLKEQQDQLEELLRWKEAKQAEEERAKEERNRTGGRASAATGSAATSIVPPPLPLTPASVPLPPVPQASAANGATTPIPPPAAPRMATGAPAARTAQPGSVAPVAAGGIQRIAFSNNGNATAGTSDKAAKDGKSEGETRHVGRYIPAGTFTRGVLLGGLDAPAGGQAQSNPHPVLIKLQDNSILPNRFRTRTRECHVVGAGYGDISSERAYMRLETLSCVLKDGKIIEVAMQGYIAGEDGKTGMRGRLVTKEGQLLGRAFLAGLGSGLGDGLSQSLTSVSTSALGSVQTVDANDILKNGAYTGVSKAMDRLAQYYITLAEKTFPVVEIAAGRPVDVVLTKGIALEEDINLAWDDMTDNEEVMEP